METRQKKIRIGPLPEGDRRGTSVAGHGRDSMLASDSRTFGCTGVGDAGGGEMSSRITADNIDVEDRSSNCSRAVTPAEDVSQEAHATQPVTTKAGKPRVRMKWNDEINLFIMRTYFYIKKLETDRTMYCKNLHDQFSIKDPDLKVTAQAIADQRRVIIRNKLLSDDVINNIKREISEQLKREESENSPARISSPVPSTLTSQVHNSQFTETNIPITTSPVAAQQTLLTQMLSHASTQTNTLPNIQSINQQIESEQTTELTQIDVSTQELINQVETALTQYTGTDPTVRPKLPKLKENKNLYAYIEMFNKQILGRFFSIDSDINSIHTLIYCSALVISENLGYKIRTPHSTPQVRNRKPEKPAWQIRIEIDIKNLRADIGRLTQYLNNNRSRKVVAEVENIFKKTQVHSVHERNNIRPEEYLDTLKQKLTLKSQRLARYIKALHRREDNKLFTTNEKSFYRAFKTDSTHSNENTEMPQVDDLKNFWADLWKKQSDHNDNAKWIESEESRMESVETMERILLGMT